MTKARLRSKLTSRLLVKHPTYRTTLFTSRGSTRPPPTTRGKLRKTADYSRRLLSHQVATCHAIRSPRMMNHDRGIFQCASQPSSYIMTGRDSLKSGDRESTQ